MTQTKNPVKANPQDLFRALEALHIKGKTYDHAPLKTVDDSQKLRGNISGLHTKNLFLKDKKKQLWLVVCEENVKINLKSLKNHIGSKALSFASTETLWEVLGVLPGSVTPFSILNDHNNEVCVVLDQNLATARAVNFHPLTNTQTITITGLELGRFLKTLHHEPILIDFMSIID